MYSVLSLDQNGSDQGSVGDGEEYALESCYRNTGRGGTIRMGVYKSQLGIRAYSGAWSPVQ